MIKIFALLTALLMISPAAFSFVGPSPELNCRDLSIGIPEQKLSVQVFAKTLENPNPVIRIERADMNGETVVLFVGEAAEMNEVAARVYLASGLRMKLVEGAEGRIQGVVSLQNEESLEHYSLLCRVQYNVMPTAATM